MSDAGNATENGAPGLGWLFFSPRGRIPRALFIQGWLFWLSLQAVAISGMFAHEKDDWLAAFALLLAIVMPLSLVSMLMLAAKRWRDIGTSGLLALLLLVPAVGFIILIVLMAIPSLRSGDEARPD